MSFQSEIVSDSSARQLQARQAYVIEVGETQAGLVARGADERYYTFISASAAFDRLEGQRFATPVAAELAARRLVSTRRHGLPLAA